MSQEIQHIGMEEINEKDVTHNWVSSSRFLFYVHVCCIMAFLLSGCYTLYTHRYKDYPRHHLMRSYHHSPCVFVIPIHQSYPVYFLNYLQMPVPPQEDRYFLDH